MSAHGKRYKEARAAIDREKAYAPAEAISILKALPDAKFDETVEVHFRLGLNVRHADEQLRGTIMLPHGTGRSMRVAVFAEGDKAREAEEAGADVVGLGRPRHQDRGRFPRLRRRDRDARPDGQRRQARPRARAARPDAEPEDRDGDLRHREGRLGREGRQARVPHRPRRERAPADRQEELRRAAAARELRRRRRGDRPREAGRGEGPLHQGHHAHDARWAPGSTSTRRAPATWPGPPIRRRPSRRRLLPSDASHPTRTHRRQPAARTSGRPVEVGQEAQQLSSPRRPDPPREAGLVVSKETTHGQEPERASRRRSRRASTRDRLADRRRLPRADERAARGASRKAARERGAAHGRQEHAHPSCGRGGRAPRRCSPCSRARRRSRSSRRTAIPSPSRRRSPTQRRTRRCSRSAAASSPGSR